MLSKKIILFIVEGITDQTCLGYTLSQLLNDNRVEFALTNGDITSRNGIDLSNIAAKVGDIVKNYASRMFRANDFIEVVHLVDMDGAYISDEHVLPKSESTPVDSFKPQRPFYSEESIYTDNVNAIIVRNRQKAAILDKLIQVNTVWRTIPYSVYYFSCNLDHVMHDQRNLLESEKYKYAASFDKKYGVNPVSFLDFLHNSEFAVKGNYGDTWSFIKVDNNSLKKYSNFHLYFSEPKNEREANINALYCRNCT